jgi:hypothetical protein
MRISSSPIAPAGILTFFLLFGQCRGEGPITITFDGPPLLAPGAGRIEGLYTEGGMFFTQHSGFGRQNSGREEWPDNGSMYLLSDNYLVPVVAASTDYSLFGLVSLELAEWNTAYPDAVTVHFIGYRPDGSTVVADRTSDGIIDGTGPLADFQTFYFEGFTGLSRLEMLGSFSLDNMTVVIPEPTGVALLALGALLACAARLAKRRDEPAERGDAPNERPSCHSQMRTPRVAAHR